MTDIEQMRLVCQEMITDTRGRQRWKGAWWNVHFSRYLSIYLTALFVRLGVTANRVTGLMLIVGLASFLCAVPHVWYLNVASLMLFLLFYILDCCDGEVARWTKSCSHGGVYLDYAAHVVCNCPLLAAAALHGSLLQKSLFWAMLAFLTVMLALWAYYFKLIIPALIGREARLPYSGEDLVPNRTLADAIRRLRLFFLDPILPLMAVVVLIILSHGWQAMWAVAAVYGLLCSLALSVMYFAVGFTKAIRIDPASPTVPGVQSGLPVA
jgi:phosphatidylglycerophosphate synthase